MFYEEVFKGLNDMGVRYVVVGGVALNLHGVPRTTADLDLAIAINEENLKRIAKALLSLGFKPKAPVDPEEFTNLENLKRWHGEKDMQVFTFWNPKRPYAEIDVFIHNPIEFDELESTKVDLTAGEIEIPLVSIDALIELKRISGRAQDLSDIAALEKIKRLKG